jgi:pilus assembly protein CpaC
VAKIRDILLFLAIAACGSMLCLQTARGAEPASPTAGQSASPSAQGAGGAQQGAPGGPLAKLVVTVGKSLIIDSPLDIRRLSVANGDLAEAVAVNPREVLINGKVPGETSLIVWQQNGSRLVYDLTVRMSNVKLEAARQQVARDFPKEDINLTFENDTVFVRGTVRDLTAADRVISIASTLGKTVNLLRVDVPPVEQQIVLKVKFANVDRSASTQWSANFLNTSFNQATQIGTGGAVAATSAVNVFLQRPDINLTAAITALQGKRVLDLLAEPNLLTISGQPASFLAGGEFPFPMVQATGGASAISIQWREYGIRLNFLPNVTPRGTIRLKVAPEVSSLDYSNAVTVQGQTVPAIASRRVQTDVELESGQSFVIAGLLDQQASDSLSKVPGIGSIPVLGKLFQSKQVNRHNSELLVIITPELVRPIPAGQPVPDLKYPMEFMAPNSGISMAHPSMDKTGPVPVKPALETVPVEQLMPKPGRAATPPPVYQMVPMAAPPAAVESAPALAPQGAGSGNSSK